MNRELTYLPCGDTGIMIKIKDEISDEAYNHVRTLSHIIENGYSDEISEIIPSYGSILVIYDPLKISYNSLITKLKKGLDIPNSLKLQPQEVVHIPVCYGGDFGPDLSFVSQHTGLDPSQVVEIHSSKPYLIYMIGFLPGFPYLGGMSDKIAAPRLLTPRLKIPAGSVGLAGSQTGIYPSDSPGGWRIIGRTPVKLFDTAKKTPVLLKASQYIKFDPVSKDEYDEIEGKAIRGCNEIKMSSIGNYASNMNSY